MASKTPKFDKALDAILKDLKPHTKKCGQCGCDFEIFKEDIEFYNKLRVPPPTLCPDCRKQRRLAFSNFTTFYTNNCSAPDHGEQLISLIPNVSKFEIYDHDFWWSDEWGAHQTQQEYDLNKAFFEQVKNLFIKVPFAQTFRGANTVASEFSAYGTEIKNCYYVFGGLKSENIIYGCWPIFSKDTVDSLAAQNCEKCYEILFSLNNYNSDFIISSDDCLDSKFLMDCKNCTNCFGGINLRNKKYVFFGEQLTKEDYEKKISQINLGSRSVFKHWEDEFKKYINSSIKKPLRNRKNVINSRGDVLIDCRNCFESFWIEEGENLRYANLGIKVRDSMDIVLTSLNSSECYENNYSLASNRLKFSFFNRASSDLEYCMDCNNCTNCFGSNGLRNKKYCVFNKQYSETEYWELVDKIKTKILKDGEYGEFFPVSMSPFPYNSTLAHIEFPMGKEKIESIGGFFFEPEISMNENERSNVLQSSDIPDDIKNVDDEIVKKILICEVTGKPFRITKPELNFYRTKSLPIPAKHPYQRILERFEKKNPFKLWDYPCSNCGKEMHTSYDPAKKLKVYCEDCYIKEVA